MSHAITKGYGLRICVKFAVLPGVPYSDSTSASVIILFVPLTPSSVRLRTALMGLIVLVEIVSSTDASDLRLVFFDVAIGKYLELNNTMGKEKIFSNNKLQNTNKECKQKRIFFSHKKIKAFCIIS